jgi:predicted transcriptional regulator
MKVKPIFAKRGRLEIIHEILVICSKPAKKTNILYKCNLSFSQLQKYLSFLITRNLISQFQSKRTNLYIITEKGKAFLDGYEELNRHLEEEKRLLVSFQSSYTNNISLNHKTRKKPSKKTE